MLNMIIRLYRKYIPFKVRNFVYKLLLGDILYFTRNFKGIVRAKLSYWFYFLIPDTPINKSFIFMGKHGICLLPYDFVLKYKYLNIALYIDESNQLPFVFHNNKKLYFPRTLKLPEVEKTYKQLLAEQDECSPHRYFNSYDELKGKIFLDIGAAEGIISLNVIDFVEHVFLFEYDENWIEALNATFAQYKNKVTIVKKFVSNINDENKLTIDRFLEGKMLNNLVIKMDIEGEEFFALQGANKTFNNAKDIKLSICTYHRRDDFEKITSLFFNRGLLYNHSNGRLFHENEFRIGLVRVGC